MEYIVEWMEMKTARTSGKPYAVLQLKDPTGTIINDISVWDNLPSLTPGAKVQGEITLKGDYKNFRFSGAPSGAPALTATRQTPEQRRDAEVNQGMREHQFRRTNELREQGIKIAAAMRDSTLIVTELLKSKFAAEVLTDADRERMIREELRKWREYFVAEFNRALGEERDAPPFD